MPAGQPTSSWDPSLPAAEDPTLILASGGASQSVGPYRIEAPIGEGGMAQVFRATHPDHPEPLALKVIQPGHAEDAEFQLRFMREARLASQISSAHVVRIRDYGRAPDGRLFLVMDYCPGQTLGSLIKGSGGLDPRLAAEYGAQALRGLEAAHALGVVHRDIKSENLITSPDGVLSVVDFGLAKQEGSQEATLTASGMILGTPSYMSPEQANGLPCDARSDLYSLGIVLYEALSGSRPFSGAPMQVLIQQIQDEPLPLEQTAPACPVSLSRIVHKALLKDPDERWQGASEFRAALEGYLEGAPEPPSPSRSKRSRGLWVVAGALALATAALAGQVGSRDVQRSSTPRVLAASSTPRVSASSTPTPLSSPEAAALDSSQAAPSPKPTPRQESHFRELLRDRRAEIRRLLDTLPAGEAEGLRAEWPRLEGASAASLAELTRVLEQTVELRIRVQAVAAKHRSSRLAKVRTRALEAWRAWLLRASLRFGLPARLPPRVALKVREAHRLLLLAERGDSGALSRARRTLGQAAELAASAARDRRTLRARLRKDLKGHLAELEGLELTWAQARDADFPAGSQRAWREELQRSIVRLHADARRPTQAFVTSWAGETRRTRVRIERALAAHRERHRAFRRSEDDCAKELRELPTSERGPWEARIDEAKRLARRDVAEGRAALDEITRELATDRRRRTGLAREQAERKAALNGAHKCLARVRQAFMRGDRRALAKLPKGARDVLLRLLKRGSKPKLEFAPARLRGLVRAQAVVRELTFFDRESGKRSQLVGYVALLERANKRWRLVELRRNP
ncbi:MAG: protein kinase [Planctomycetes bacterium]|nr:protein kinase [Planctomycetota bacterium]